MQEIGYITVLLNTNDPVIRSILVTFFFWAASRCLQNKWSVLVKLISIHIDCRIISKIDIVACFDAIFSCVMAMTGKDQINSWSLIINVSLLFSPAQVEKLAQVVIDRTIVDIGCY